MKLFHTSAQTIEAVVEQELFPFLMQTNARIITFEGPLGAGKTTIIKIIVRLLGVLETTNSPTFSYVNSYKTQNGLCINHFDLYRLGSLYDFYDEALDELLIIPEAYNFIEWPNVIEPILKQKSLSERCLSIKIAYDLHQKDERIITCL